MLYILRLSHVSPRVVRRNLLKWWGTPLSEVLRQGANIPLCSGRNQCKARTESCFCTLSCPHVENHNTLQKECQSERKGKRKIFSWDFQRKKGEGKGRLWQQQKWIGHLYSRHKFMHFPGFQIKYFDVISVYV